MSMSADMKANTRGGGALELGDLRLLEDCGERGGALGSDVVAFETASEGWDGDGERVGVSMGADTTANTWRGVPRERTALLWRESRLGSLCSGHGPCDTPETAHRGRGRQHEAEQLCPDVAKPGMVEVQAADCIVLLQLLYRNPAHRPTRRAGDSCEQQLVWWLTLALDAAAQGRTA